MLVKEVKSKFCGHEFQFLRLHVESKYGVTKIKYDFPEKYEINWETL